MSDSDIFEIDAGNTCFKWRLLSGGIKVSSGRAPKVDVTTALEKVLSGSMQINSVRIVSVAGQNFDCELQDFFVSKGVNSVKFARVESQTKGLVCAYKDVSQLGVDRWLALIAAADSFAGPVVVADMGSALTIDLIDGGRRHRGGYILPGLGLMRMALREGTNIDSARIPENYHSKVLKPGDTTLDAIGMGGLKALSSTVNSAVNDFEEFLGVSVTLVCTGGDAPGIVEHLESEAIYVEDLVLDGLAIALG